MTGWSWISFFWGVGATLAVVTALMVWAYWEAFIKPEEDFPKD